MCICGECVYVCEYDCESYLIVIAHVAVLVQVAFEHAEPAHSCRPWHSVDSWQCNSVSQCVDLLALDAACGRGERTCELPNLCSVPKRLG